jgi:hypothetical protein
MDKESNFNDTENGKKKECSTCFGNGFIYLGTTSSACPDCWGIGEEEDSENGEEY